MSAQSAVGCGGGFRPAACVPCGSVQWGMDGTSHCAVKKTCLTVEDRLNHLPLSLDQRNQNSLGLFVGRATLGQLGDGDDSYRGVCS